MLVWTHSGLLQFLEIGQGVKVVAGFGPTKVNSAKVMILNSMRACYVLLAMDYYLKSDVEVVKVVVFRYFCQGPVLLIVHFCSSIKLHVLLEKT